MNQYQGYPENGGAFGKWTSKTLNVGDKIDRYGSLYGKFFKIWNTMEMGIIRK